MSCAQLSTQETMPETVEVVAQFIRPAEDPCVVVERGNVVRTAEQEFPLTSVFPVGSPDLSQHLSARFRQKALEGINTCFISTGGRRLFSREDGPLVAAISECFLPEEQGRFAAVRISSCQLLPRGQCRDLLQGGNIKLRFSSLCGVDVVAGLAERRVGNLDVAVEQLRRARANEQVRGTLMNAECLRGHVMTRLTMSVEGEDGIVRESTHLFCDLPRPERVLRVGATGETLKEVQEINVSWNALSEVVTALTRPVQKHVPYRSHCLTRILQHSLGGNCSTMFVGNLSQQRNEQAETISMLGFLNRCMRVTNNPVPSVPKGKGLLVKSATKSAA
mmetsp:Transcript_547/g.1077  ORF Transcript_547/g.1077 Transcript_547/m.1077 type:complete len:334 (-) Transcript_547:28-1029(-)